MRYPSQPQNRPRQADIRLNVAIPRSRTSRALIGASVVQQLENRPAREDGRVCVRLDREQTAWLEERCRETGSTSSDVIRAALRATRGQAERMKALLGAAMGRESTRSQRTPPAATPGTGAQTAAGVIPSDIPRFPRELWAVVAQLRSFGPTAWSERRRRFIWLVGLTQISLELSKERRDAELLADLLRLGTKYGLLPSDR